MFKTAISGASGFIGSHLSSLMRPSIKIPRDLIDDFTNIIITLKGMDTVVHCASYGNHSSQINEPEIFKVNVKYTNDLLRASQVIGVKNFIYFSSSSELGKKDKPMHEEMVARPETMYGVCKACGTQLTRYYSKYLNTVIVRPFSVTGVDEQEKHLIPTLIRSCLYGEKMKFVPEPVHDFIDIEDLCQGVLLLLKNIKKVNGEIFHLGCGIQYSNQEVLEIVEEVTGKKANIELVESLRSYDAKIWTTRHESKIKTLGWKQTKTLEQSIREMVQHEIKTENN
jgi:UDP-glucose 4-epimerase